jgi:hypothetical protein
MNAQLRNFDGPIVRLYSTKPFNPTDYNIVPRTAEIKGGSTIEIRATCVGCNQQCFITTDGACVSVHNITTNSYEKCKDLSRVGAVLKTLCQSTLVLQKP